MKTPQKNRFGMFAEPDDDQQPASMPPPSGPMDRNRGPSRSMTGGRGSRGASADSERQRALQGFRQHQDKLHAERQPQQQQKQSNGPAAAADKVSTYST